jgi:hypothetical protein
MYEKISRSKYRKDLLNTKNFADKKFCERFANIRSYVNSNRLTFSITSGSLLGSWPPAVAKIF